MSALLTINRLGYQRQRGRLRLAIFDGLDLEIRGGEILALMGQSGVGKSTLVNLAAGYLLPTAGEIREGGVRVVGPARSRLVVFQSGGLWPWLTLRKNAALGLQSLSDETESAEIVDVILERLRIADACDAYPGELSGGMQKRAELARAILARPRILMLDEALNSVDTITKEICVDVIREFQADEASAVVVVSHNVDEVVHLADRVLILDGSPATVRTEISINGRSLVEREAARSELLHALGHHA